MWRAAFLGGMAVGARAVGAAMPRAFESMPYSYTMARALASGLLVGYGAALGSGCTSGHGIAGNARFSKRSTVATCVPPTTCLPAAGQLQPRMHVHNVCTCTPLVRMPVCSSLDAASASPHCWWPAVATAAAHCAQPAHMPADCHAADSAVALPSSLHTHGHTCVTHHPFHTIHTTQTAKHHRHAYSSTGRPLLRPSPTTIPTPPVCRLQRAVHGHRRSERHTHQHRRRAGCGEAARAARLPQPPRPRNHEHHHEPGHGQLCCTGAAVTQAGTQRRRSLTSGAQPRLQGSERCR